MAGQKTSLTNSDLDILKDEPGSYTKQERRYHQYVEDHREPDTAERPVNHSSEVDFRPQSLLKHQIDLSPIHKNEGDSPGLNERDIKLQDFVELEAVSNPVVESGKKYTMQEHDEIKV